MADHESQAVSNGMQTEAEKEKLSSGSLRASGSKIANLRAAFEKELSNGSISVEPPKIRRLMSSDRSSSQNAEIARLKEELEKEKDLRIAFEEKCTSLEDEMDQLHEQLEQRDDVWRLEYERKSNGLMHEKAAAESKARDRANSLAKQLTDLKRSISTSTRIESHVMTDSTSAQEMGMLHHEVQNWVVNNFRKAKTDTAPDELCKRLEGSVSSTQVERLRPIYVAFDASTKLAVYQATVMCFLMDIFNEPLLYALPEDRGWCQAVKAADQELQLVLSPSAYNKWRANTFDSLRQCSDMEDTAERAASHMSRIICKTLCMITEMEESEARETSLKSITKRAISLAHLFRVQRAQYDIKLPAPGHPFDPSIMESESHDMDIHSTGLVRCAVLPAVVKLGDEQGENEQLRSVVAKAKVLCHEP